MAKSKKKSSVLRSAQQDYDYCSSRSSSSNAQGALSRSVSPAIQRPSSPSRTSSPPPNPPRATIALADVVNSQRLSRVRTKYRNKGIRHTPSIAPPLSSPRRCRPNTSSPVSTQTRRGPLSEHGSPNPRPGVGNPNLEAMTGAAAPPPSHMPGQATTVSHRSSSPVCPTSTPTVPQSPSLVHFSSYKTTSSCTFLDTDVGMYKDRWRFSLIGFIADKFPGYTSLSTFINSSWKRNVNFSMTRLSYARVLVETDLLADLPAMINISLPNGVTMTQKVLYESLPRFCKQCRTLGHNTSSCANNSSHKRKKRAQPTPSPSGCSNPSADTEAVEKQPLREEPQGEPEFDPMSAEAAVAREERAAISDRKRAKLATHSGPLGDHPPGSPPVVSVEDDTTAELPPRRQYLTRSKAAATSGRSGKALWKSHSSAATLGNIASASSSSL